MINVLENELNLGTEKYKHVKTQDVINHLKSKMTITDVKVKKSRSTSMFSKHIVELRTDTKIGTDSFLTLILTNSYDGKHALNFRLGVYRLVCSNGLIAGTDFFRERVLHIGNTYKQLDQVVETLPMVAKQLETIINRASSIEMNAQDRFKLIYRALRIRGVPSDAQIDFRGVLKPLRVGDTNNDKWSVFNIVQEKLTRTGFHVFENGKPKKIRAIKGIHSQNELNQKLFKLVA